MKAAIYINEREPGLIPWGYFQIMLPGILTGLEVVGDEIRKEIFSEWMYELFIDELETQEFNFIVSKISDHVNSLNKEGLSDRFVAFWNDELAPIILNDIRYVNGFRSICT